MRGAFAWTAGVVALALSLGVAYAAYLLADHSWDQVVSYETPFGDYDRAWALGALPPEVELPADAHRVVLVIVDGLRLDVTDQMPNFQTLRQYGADMVALTVQPSLSYPTWTAILSGATPDVSGVTTNWFDGAVPVETVIDTALGAGRTVVVSGPQDLATLYAADRAQATFFREWTKEYMSGTYVDQAIALADGRDPSLVVVHLPDTDDAGHEYGGTSDEYILAAQRIDGEIMRLVAEFADDRTLFVITSDHGHVQAGGHGGWEPVVTRVPALFIGPASSIDRERISQTDIAPTVAAFLGVPVPAHAEGRVRPELLLPGRVDSRIGDAHAKEFATGYLATLGAPDDALAAARTADQVAVVISDARTERLAADRAERLPLALALGALVLRVPGIVFASSWRAGTAIAAGVLAYYLVYNGLYFIVHGHRWSLSAFNTESFVEQFFYLRMAEAALAGVIGAAVAAGVYPLLRSGPKGPRDRRFLGGWLALGPATVFVIMATLVAQVAWFYWAWGFDVVWRLPDMRWGFKYLLDLTQITALGAAAVLAPVVTYLAGRFHPRVRIQTAEE